MSVFRFKHTSNPIESKEIYFQSAKKIQELEVMVYTIFDCVLIGPMPLKSPKYQTPGEIWIIFCKLNYNNCYQSDN